MEISAWIDYWAGWTADKTALRFEGSSVSYRELEERISRTAGSLRARGVDRGDRVAYLGPNCPELLELFFACARIGAIFVPLNARMPAAELRVFIDKSEPRLVVAADGLHSLAIASAPHLSQEAIVVFVAGESLPATGSNAVRADHEADPDAPVLIAFTSGTTGTPKGAVHTNAGIISNALDAVAGLEISSRDETLVVLPMFHVAGLNILTSPALSAGATVTVHRRFDAAAALGDIERFGVTLFLATPPMTLAMTTEPAWATTDFRSMRAQLVGGTVVTDEAIRPWRERGVRVVQGYGMTEVGPVATLVPLPDVPRKSLTAGKPTLHTHIRIVDRAGNDLPSGESGEVLMRSPSVATGYWRNPEATRDAIPDGWFHTGDFGFIDDDGFLYIVDRIKEIIIVGVSNVYPGDVEAVLAASPDIAEASVVGLPDPELGEVPVAFIVRAPGASLTEREALALFDGRLAPYKHPRHVIFVDEVPRTAVGKIEKTALRALARSRLLGERDDQLPLEPQLDAS